MASAANRQQLQATVEVDAVEEAYCRAVLGDAVS
jgi:hypothetical protein